MAPKGIGKYSFTGLLLVIFFCWINYLFFIKVNKTLQMTRYIETSGRRNFRGDNSSNGLDNFVLRRILTQSDYPMTFNAPFIIDNPQICSGNVTVLIIVHTSTDHFSHRTRYRQTFANVNLFKEKYVVKIVFLLGLTEHNETTAKIVEENKKYGDIVQIGFKDSYRNLTLKGVMGFRWVFRYCSHAEIVVKLDDDVVLDIFKLLEHYMPLYASKENVLACRIMSGSRVVREPSKWNVDRDFFRGVRTYPEYCSGFVVVMSTGAIRKMSNAAQFTPFFWVDDVYLFGLLPSKSNISRTDIGTELSLTPQKCKDRFDNHELTPYLACLIYWDNDFDILWRKTLERLSPSMRKYVNETFLTKTMSGFSNESKTVLQ